MKRIFRSSLSIIQRTQCFVVGEKTLEAELQGVFNVVTHVLVYTICGAKRQRIHVGVLLTYSQRVECSGSEFVEACHLNTVLHLRSKPCIKILLALSSFKVLEILGF